VYVVLAKARTMHCGHPTQNTALPKPTERTLAVRAVSSIQRPP
jgi:hypothetical protein